MSTFQKAEVQAPPGNTIGYIEQTWSICRPKYRVLNANGQTVLRIVGPCFTCNLCGDIEFQVWNRNHYIDITWLPRHLKSPATRLFVQQLVKANIKENIISKFHITGPLWGESTSDQWIPLTKGRNAFPCHGVMHIHLRNLYETLVTSLLMHWNFSLALTHCKDF